MALTPKQNRETAYEGLANIAHAIRRVGAGQIAISMCPPSATDDEVFAMAERWAVWLRGSAEDPAERPKWRAPED